MGSARGVLLYGRSCNDADRLVPITVSDQGQLQVSGGSSSSGGLTDTQLRATPVPVSGFPATQTITGSVSVSNWPASQAVTGAFWQATQPVSIASMPSTPVTGAFWQATQPVSGTFWQATQPVSGPLTDGQLRTSAVPVSGTFFQATQPVSVAAQVKAREDTAAMTWTSLKSAAPAIGAVQADTGALAAGDYDFEVFMCASDTAAVGKGLVIEHRDAANAATLQTLGGIPAGVSDRVTLRRYTIVLNQRIRVIAGTAAGAASSMYVSAIGRRVS